MKQCVLPLTLNELHEVMNKPSLAVDQWERHPEVLEIVTLQGRRPDDESAERDEEEDDSSSEPDEEEDRDADDDEDAYGDDEDESVRSERKGKTVTLNMFGLLGENECE